MRRANGDAYCWFIAGLLCKGFFFCVTSLHLKQSLFESEDLDTEEKGKGCLVIRGVISMSDDLLLMADSLQLKNPIDVFMDVRSIFTKSHRVRFQF